MSTTIAAQTRRHFAPLLLTALLAAAPALAQDPIPLWHRGETPYPPGTSTCAQGQIPIGSRGQSHRLQAQLRDYLASIQAQDVDFGTLALPYQIDLPWLSSNHGSGQTCVNDPAWPVVLPSVKPQIEELFLHEAGEEWVDHGLMRMYLKPGHFLLQNLENTLDCHIHVPSFLHDPELSSWANLKYDGNPFFTDPTQRRVLKTRGAVWLTMYLLILEYETWSDATVKGAFPCPVGTPGCSHTVASISPFTGLVVPTKPTGAIFYGTESGGLAQLSGLGNGARSFTELGGLLAVLAGTYLQVRDQIPARYHTSYERMFLNFADRLANMPVYPIMSNLDHRSLVALRIIEEIQPVGAQRTLVRNMYTSVAPQFYSTTSGFWGIFQPQGTFRDVGGFDTGYNNYNLLHMARLLFMDPPASEPPGLRSAAERAFSLWGHLVFEDTTNLGGRHYLSPSAYNTRTGRGPADGHLGGGTFRQRLLLAGMEKLPFAWAGLAHTSLPYPWDEGGPGVDPWIWHACHHYLYELDPNYPNSPIYQMQQTGNFGNFNFAQPPLYPDPELITTPGFGLYNRAYETPNFAFLFGRNQGILNQWNTVAGTSVEEFPYEQTTAPYFKDFTNGLGQGGFYYAKPAPTAGTGKYIALVHAGQVGLPVPGQLPRGYGGGQLSALWNEDGKVFWLARRRGNNYSSLTQDDNPAEWRSIALHAVSIGRGAGGPDWTSTAAEVMPVVHDHLYTAGAPAITDAFNAIQHGAAGCQPPTAAPVPLVANTQAQHIRVCGNIPVQGTGGTGFLPGPIPYRRDFLMGDGYIAVETELTPSVLSPIEETYETLPLYYGHPDNHATGDWSVTVTDTNNITTTYTFTSPSAAPILAQKVVVQRFGGTLEITFPTPEWVSLADPWSGANAGYANRNLLIHVYHGATHFAPRTVRYLLETW